MLWFPTIIQNWSLVCLLTRVSILRPLWPMCNLYIFLMGLLFNRINQYLNKLFIFTCIVEHFNLFTLYLNKVTVLLLSDYYFLLEIYKWYKFNLKWWQALSKKISGAAFSPMFLDGIRSRFCLILQSCFIRSYQIK